MQEYLTQTGKPIHLAKKLASGGEGEIYEISSNPDLLAKIYLPRVLHERQGDLEKKLPLMTALADDLLLNNTAWPQGTLYDKKTKRLTGFVMKKIEGHKEIHLLYGPKSRIRDFPDAGWSFLIHAAINVARVFEVIHNCGHIIGDINARSVLVSNQATVQLIDCDSFQITYGNEQFPCHVGVPEYTSPELQGRSLKGLARNQGHDSFGLAVLIFQLLFMGRHPFHGTYLGKGDKNIEESIKEHRFAYGAGALARNVRQPPGSPSLEIVPMLFGDLFERAFTTTTSGNRPAPAEWSSALRTLSQNLIKCGYNAGHHYWGRLPQCPWCKLERESGLKLFLGVLLQNLSQSGFDLVKVWREISGITLPRDTFPAAPNVLHQRLNLFGYGKSLGVDTDTLSLRRILLATNLAMIVWLAGSVWWSLSPTDTGSSPADTGLISCVIGLLCLFLPYRSYAKQRKKLETDKSLVEARSNQGKLSAQLKNEKQAFQQKVGELAAIKQQYENLGTELHQKLVNLEKNSRQRQLEKFLDSFDIYDARITGIGEQRKATLISYGIETAADVSYTKIKGVIPGFGPVNTSSLVAWKQSLESRFVFDPNKGIDPADRQAVEQEIALKRRNGETELSAGPVRLKQIIERVTLLQEQIKKDIDLNSKDIEEVGKKLAFLLQLKKLFVPLWGILLVQAVWWLSVSSSPIISQNIQPFLGKPVRSTGSGVTNSQQLPVEKDIELAASFYKQGVGYTKSRQFEKAIELYQQAITANPDYAEAYHELGYALFRLNRYEEAVIACQKAISLRPRYTDTYRNLANCFAAKGDTDNQIFTLKVAVSLAPKHLESTYQLAEALFQKESYEEAADYYVKALKLNPEFDHAWYKLGLLFLRTGEIEKAREIVDQLQNHNTDLANSLSAEILKEIR